MVLRFNNRIEKKLSRVRLVGAAGETLDLAVAVTGRADTLKAGVPVLSPGPWRVEWQVLSTDGHVVSGVFSFRLAPEAAAAGEPVPRFLLDVAPRSRDNRKPGRTHHPPYGGVVDHSPR